MEEFELVVTEENKFENGAKEKKLHFLKLRIAKTLMQGAQIGNSRITNLYTSRILSMATLIEEIKPVVLMKYEFKYREKIEINFF